MQKNICRPMFMYRSSKNLQLRMVSLGGLIFSGITRTVPFNYTNVPQLKLARFCFVLIYPHFVEAYSILSIIEARLSKD
jgi:hypothetical protein